MACAETLGIDEEKLNVNGGAIALGHPLGNFLFKATSEPFSTQLTTFFFFFLFVASSGARITGHLVHELKRKNLKRGIGAACIGGGQGIAVLIESV